MSAAAPAHVVRAAAGTAGRGPDGCPGPIRALLGRDMVLAVLAVTALAVPLRLAAPGLLAAAGPVLLLLAVLAGLPHGALDPDLVTGGRPARLLCGAGYLACATLVYLAWARWPAGGVGLLLASSAGHFAVADLAVGHWRRPADPIGGAGGLAVRAAVTGTLAVAGPFAWWPSRTGPLLSQLAAGSATSAITQVCRLAWVVAVLAGLLSTLGAVRRRDPTGAAEPAALALLTGVCPPLVAFAVYFAGWHSLRQTLRLLAVHPGALVRLRDAGTGSALRLLALRAAVPTLVALAGLAALTIRGAGLSAGLLAALLAISVPHALVTGYRELTAG